MTSAAVEFMKAAPKPLNGNSAWASRYAAEVRRVVFAAAADTPRSLQRHLGPSEIGHACDRRVAAKLAGLERTNHVQDPWPAILGTAGHAWLEQAFRSENERLGRIRWVPEARVTPIDGHPGTADLYDADEFSCVDHKILGPTSMAKIRSAGGPPRHYVVQLLAYARGFRRLGLPVRRVVILAYPRTLSSLDGLYVWERPYTPADDVLLDDVAAQLTVRKQWAAALLTGAAQLTDVPADIEDCHFCLSGDTEVVTRAGLRPIRELAGSTHALLVPTKSAWAQYAAFQDAPVRSFGRQKLYAVNLRRYRATKTVYATADHRWVLADERVVVPTKELAKGTRLSTTRAPLVRATSPMSVAVAQGFTYGDGTKPRATRPTHLSIYGRSEKQVMVDYFGPIKRNENAAANGDTVTILDGLPNFWKKLPPIDESRTFLLSWLAGYFAADGSVAKSGQASISSSRETDLAFVRDVAAICGIGYGQICSSSRLGFGSELSMIHKLSLDVRDFPDWFWLLPTHRERALAKTATASNEAHWLVVSVEPTKRIEEVFCATVSSIGAFALGEGLTTGNCEQFRPQSARDGGAGCPGNAQ